MDLDLILKNPIVLIFLSYTLGALITDFLKVKGWVSWFHDRDYISDRLTKSIGVLPLGWLIRKTWLGKFNAKLKYSGIKDVATLEKLKEEMTYAGMGHLIAFFALLILNVLFIFWNFDWWYIIVFFCINIVLNLYLVFLQQYNRRRIERILKFLKR